MCVIVRALRVILPEVSGMTGTPSTCTHPGASLSYEVTGSPYPSLIFSPMNLRIHHASSGALDLGSVHAPYRSEKGKVQHLGLPDNEVGAISPGRLPLQLNKHRRCVPDTFAPVEQFSSPSSMVISPGGCHDQSIPVRKFATRLRTYRLMTESLPTKSLLT